MKRLNLLFLFFASLLPAALPAATIDFDLLPNATISGTAGSKIGWGYTVTNNSPDQWLVFMDLSSDPFTSGTPNALFDFPILAPEATVTQTYDSALGTGLLELTLNSFFLNTVIDSGNFVLDAQWWSGDPSGSGTFLSDADPIIRSYTAIGSPVPEPATLLLLGSALTLVFSKRRK